MKNAALYALKAYKQEYPNCVFRVVGVRVTQSPLKAFNACKEVSFAEVLLWSTEADYKAGARADEWALVILDNGPEECLADMTAGGLLESADNERFAAQGGL